MQNKICHITTVHKANDNRIFYKECYSLVQAGYQVTLLCAGADTIVKNGIQIIGFKKSQGRLKRMLSTSLFKAFKMTKSINATLYHLHDPELMPLGLLLKISGKKVIMDVHENNPAALLSRPYLKSTLTRHLLSSLIKMTERFCLRFYDGIITARPDISSLFPKFHPVTLRNFPILPLLNEIPDLKIKKNKPSVIYVGGLSKIRGIIELINAFSLINDAELWLLGPFESDEFEKECKNLEGWKNVNYLGKVDATQIFSYIVAADIGIITFLPLPNHITTLATKPFEYMACGLPMIMSDFLYWRDFFGACSLYVDPSDSKAIASCIEKLLKDNKLRASMREMNLSLIKEEYNWIKEKDKLLELYQRVLSS